MHILAFKHFVRILLVGRDTIVQSGNIAKYVLHHYCSVTPIKGTGTGRSIILHVHMLENVLVNNATQQIVN